MDIRGRWTNLRYWKKGAILGFLFIPAWFSVSVLLMLVAALTHSNTFGGIAEAFFMLIIVPMSIIHQILGISHIFPILTSIPFWTLIGAVIGYFVDKRKG